ncbi:MBL fold metallo-hydrolase [Telmatospirillum siberiense]|uniref:Metallo-beta-lactamase domain-containing protein n=1 Tax=Telmatospirillum siberiense TaxID=382514 RepID=A0A2N3PQW8_9PROT|nr:MBL fold metallo-hydrolase [Telmatospirillum siberiense]PKU22784.1 hypothetical protein CWS72_20145 [Telmatospirillum siberiense]
MISSRVTTDSDDGLRDLHFHGRTLFEALEKFAASKAEASIKVLPDFWNEAHRWEAPRDRYNPRKSINTRSYEILKLLQASLIEDLRRGRLVGLGYRMPRCSADAPELIPFDVWSDDIQWVLGTVQGGGLDYVGVRIIARPANRTRASQPSQRLAKIGHKVRLIDGEYDVFGDGSVTCLPTHGHTPGHQSLRLRLASGDLVLAADACYFCRTLRERRLPRYADDREAMLASLDRLEALERGGARIVFGHDPAFRSIVPHPPEALD